MILCNNFFVLINSGENSQNMTWTWKSGPKKAKFHYEKPYLSLYWTKKAKIMTPKINASSYETYDSSHECRLVSVLFQFHRKVKLSSSQNCKIDDAAAMPPTWKYYFFAWFLVKNIRNYYFFFVNMHQYDKDWISCQKVAYRSWEIEFSIWPHLATWKFQHFLSFQFRFE